MPHAFNSHRRTILQTAAAIGLAGPLATAAQAATDRRAWSSSHEAYDGPFQQRFNGTLKSVVLVAEGRLER